MHGLSVGAPQAPAILGHALDVAQGSREAGLAMAFKLLLQAEAKWRRLNAPHLLPLVQTGMKFLDGETKMLADMPAKSEHIEVLEDAAL